MRKNIHRELLSYPAQGDRAREDSFLSQLERREAQSRALQKWVLFALLFSLFIHLLLYWSFEKYELYQYFDKQSSWQLGANKAHQLKKEKRVRINSKLINDSLPLSKASSSQATKLSETKLPLVDETLELIELQQNLPEKEIRLTPSIKEAQNFSKGSTSVSEEAPAAIDNSVSDTNNALEAALEAESISSSNLSSTVHSEKQLLLSSADALQDSDLSSLNGNDTEALLDSISNNSNTQQNLPPGFSDLDSLLGYSGGLPANTDPVLMPTDLLFAYDKVDVLGGARLSLMKLGILIQKNPSSTFIIEGHSDSFGDNNYNMQLSLRRAHAVKNWLVQSLRLNGSRILIRGRGEEKPLVSQQGSIAQQSLNRRVEIIIEK